MVQYPEAALFNHANQLLDGHERLLRDEHRNRAFYAALQRCVTTDSVVLDIGSGTGLWAIAAARLGAKRVVAIEQDALLIGLIQALAQANDVADRVEVLQGDSRQLHLDREFDVVISETIGHLVFDEDVATIMLDARRRFLKPGGTLIPQEVALVAAAAHYEQPRLPHGLPVLYGEFETLLLHHPVGQTVGLPEGSQLNAQTTIKTVAQSLVRADLTRIEAPPSLSQLTARWELSTTADINSFAVWAEVTLLPGLRLETRQTSSWFPTLYRIRPFQRDQGALEFKLTLMSHTHYWTATLAHEASLETQTYSPASAATTLLALTRTHTNLLNHLQHIGVTP